MDRENAMMEVKERVKAPHLISHMLAVEAVMMGLAKRLNEDVEKWGICGLVHDIDYEETGDSPERHSIVGAEILKGLNYPEDVIYAVKVHNDTHNLPRISLMDKALYAADPVTGLITACALVMPEKKLKDVEIETVTKKMKRKDFAKGVNREQIKTVEEIGITLEEFIKLSLDCMRSISNTIGL